MKFISKHTEGPWHPLSDPIKEKTMDIRGKDGRRISVVVMDYPMGVKTMDANINLILQAPTMRDYLIERAKKLDASISLTGSSDILMQAFGDFQKEDKQELTRIIEILKAAGVEVVNE